MTIFNKMLLAIDLSPDSDNLLSRVLKFCREDMEKVSVVHVLRSDFHISGPGDIPFMDVDLRQERDKAVVRLNDLLRRNGFRVDAGQIHIRIGEPATEIKRLAHELQADLVIVGSHCKKGGWLALPGATTNCVLQGIETDVMAVRV